MGMGGNGGRKREMREAELTGLTKTHRYATLRIVTHANPMKMIQYDSNQSINKSNQIAHSPRPVENSKIVSFDLYSFMIDWLSSTNSTNTSLE